jgi:hypothetical protein
MQIRMAHIREQGQDLAIFDAKPTSDSDSSRARLLSQLTSAAEAAGLNVDKAALVFTRNGRLAYFGPPDLVDFLKRRRLPSWNRTLTIS